MAQTAQPNPALPPETPVDAGSQALAEALRSSFAIVRVVMVVLVIVFLGSGFFRVESQQRAIILRMGRPVQKTVNELLGPGLHWSFPYPIDECVKVSISGIQQVKSSVGWYAVTPAQEAAGVEPPAGGTLNPVIDGYVLTADNNIVHTRATLTYHIKDPVQYVFGFANTSNAVQHVLDEALLEGASKFTVDDILTRDVIRFREAVRSRVTQLADERNLGIVVEQCPVQSIWPRQTKDAFLSVIRAEENRNKVVNEAYGTENQITNKASADAASIINNAEADRVRRVNDISSRAGYFLDLLPKYQANPNLFVQRAWTESLGRVLTNVQDKVFVSEGAAGNPRELRYLFNREPPKPKEEEKKP